MSPLSPDRRKKHKSKDFQTPCVVFQPYAMQGMARGIHKLVALIRPTLGPLPHNVAIEQLTSRNSLPEILDSGGTIARRIFQIADRDEDIGFMFLRQVLWKLHESEGDGTAFAAVMFETIFDQARRYITAGGDPMQLRYHLEAGLRLILLELDRQTVRISGKQQLAGLARTICYEDELARMLGEIFDIIGAYGRLEVRSGSGLEMEREYVEGMYWDGALRSREMGNAEFGMRANLENAAVLISDLEIETPEQLVPLLSLAVSNKIKQVLLVSKTLSEKAMALLTNKANRERVEVFAVHLPGSLVEAQRDALEDLSILTGGRVFLSITGDTLETLKLEDLGCTRRAWADNHFFGIIGGRGNPRTLRQHINTLRKVYHTIENPEDRRRLLERLGKLIGGSATLYIGGISPSAIEARSELAKRTASAMRGAISDGVVPGGGIALLNCRAVLEPCLKESSNSDERAAYKILLMALETPFRILVSNAGYQPGKVLAEVQMHTGQNGDLQAGFDVLTGKVADISQFQAFDAASVVKGAVRSAIGGAALALTTEVLVHKKNPPEQINT